MPKQNFEAFRGLLRGAICNRTQAQFANESGISPEHLSRMLNADVIFRPSKTTLHKIAAVAKNGITYQILKDALDQDDPNSVSPEDQAEKTAAAAADFCPEFPVMAREVMEVLCEEINGQTFPIMADSLAAYMDPLVSAVAKRKPDYPKISYDLGFIRPYPGRKYDCATKYVRVDLSMADEFDVATSDMLLYFTEIPCQDGTVKYVIQKASCAVEDIMELFGLPPAAIDAHTDRDMDDEMKDADPETIDAALKDPFYIEFEETTQSYEKSKDQSASTIEQKLLRAVFGGDACKCPASVDGIGFRLEETPPNLLKFFLAHRKAVLSPFEDEPENYNDVSTAMDTMEKTGELQPFLDKLDYHNYTDHDINNCLGWQAAIAVVMSEETGFPFVFMRKSEDPEGKFPWLSQHSVIILPKEDSEKNGIQREAILNATSRYVRELGLKRFGDQLFVYIQTLYRHPYTYVIKENSAADNEPEDNAERKDEDYSVRFKDDPHPEADGVYAVKLKDGRRMNLVYLASHKAWIKLHREWSDLIESYCPEPIQKFASAQPPAQE